MPRGPSAVETALEGRHFQVKAGAPRNTTENVTVELGGHVPKVEKLSEGIGFHPLKTQQVGGKFASPWIRQGFPTRASVYRSSFNVHLFFPVTLLLGTQLGPGYFL